MEKNIFYDCRNKTSLQAGRLYDRIGDTAQGIVKYVLPQGVLCELVSAKTEGEKGEINVVENV